MYFLVRKEQCPFIHDYDGEGRMIFHAAMLNELIVLNEQNKYQRAANSNPHFPALTQNDMLLEYTIPFQEKKLLFMENPWDGFLFKLAS